MENEKELELVVHFAAINAKLKALKICLESPKLEKYKQELEEAKTKVAEKLGERSPKIQSLLDELFS